MKIAIVNSHVSYSTGGSQLQCDLIARELLARGHEVHYVAAKSPGLLVSAPYVIHSVGSSGGEIGRSCVAIRPDIVYWRFNKKGFYRAARIVAREGIPIVFSVSHVADIQKWASKMDLRGASARLAGQVIMSRLLSRWNYRGFKFVDALVANNSMHLGHVPVARQLHINNSLPAGTERNGAGLSWPRPYCLWVANLKPQKQPEVYLALAEALRSSGVDFLMVGQVQARRYASMMNSPEIPKNFYYLGAKDNADVSALLRDCLLLVHTCLPEGFPNIFIQAWNHGKPVVSLCFDPDNILQAEGVGFCSGSIEQLARDVEELILDDARRAAIGARAEVLAAERFSLSANVDKLERVFRDVVAARELRNASADPSVVRG